LAERGAALEAANHPLQVTSGPAPLPLFARVGGERLLLVERGSHLALKGRDGSFEAEEVVERFASGAWLPSFSALTRPLAASPPLPAAATILGPPALAPLRPGRNRPARDGSAPHGGAHSSRHGAPARQARLFRHGCPRGAGGDAEEEGDGQGAGAPESPHGRPGGCDPGSRGSEAGAPRRGSRPREGSRDDARQDRLCV